MCPEHKSATRVAKTDMRSPVPRRKRKEDIQIPIIKWGHKTKIINIDWLWKPFIPCSKVTIFEGVQIVTATGQQGHNSGPARDTIAGQKLS